MASKSTWIAGLAVVMAAAAPVLVALSGEGGTASTAPPGTAGQDGRKIAYYRNPMGLPDTSPMPKKDSMGMDYIPVYADEAGEKGAGVKLSLDRVQRAGVRSETVEMRRLVRPVRAPGIAQFDERTIRAVTLRADGFIEKLHVAEHGAHVKEGEPLFRVYSPAMVSAQVDYGIASRNPIGGDPAASTKGAEQKLKNLEIPQSVIAELRRTGEAVMSIDWPSPASGVVMEKKVVEGQMMRTGEELFRIADLSKLWVIAEIAEQDMGLVAIGQPATVRFKAFPGTSFEGRVTFILHELDHQTRTGKARVEIGNPAHKIKHEMYADAEIEAGTNDEPRVAVPRSAVIDSGKRQVVLLDKGDGRFEPREVKLGMRGDGYIEVTEGVAAGDKVVVTANFLIDAESNLKAALQGFTTDIGGSAEGTEGGR